MHDIGADTWIMHGTLLGWWWNQKIMPWDSDLDVQISEKSMQFLADYYNMTVHHFKNIKLPEQTRKRLKRKRSFSNRIVIGEEKGEVHGDDLKGVYPAEDGRRYLLEVNPNWVNNSTDDKHNVIDARWIDTATGLFIDITTLRYDHHAEASGYPGRMYCKDKHHYSQDQIFPLRDSEFEGMPVKIPYSYSELLIEEYTPSSLTNKNFENHVFDEETMEWIPLKHVYSKKSPEGAAQAQPVNSRILGRGALRKKDNEGVWDYDG
jgi:hypothetical protein